MTIPSPSPTQIERRVGLFVLMSVYNQGEISQNQPVMDFSRLPKILFMQCKK
jgi:hypothetical protein